MHQRKILEPILNSARYPDLDECSPIWSMMTGCSRISSAPLYSTRPSRLRACYDGAAGREGGWIEDHREGEGEGEVYCREEGGVGMGQAYE
ncbi:hypothetical protein M405DRAFT_98481 [Rhizopogon salebrosus TDB-379]|nr:hypothetical protein M405DRAFT_98481 [Rhizopogon salebrosus TDB-379]